MSKVTQTKPPSAGRLEAGFTLIELLAVLVITGLILAMIGQGTRLGLMTRTALNHEAWPVEELANVETTLRFLIAGASPGESGASTVFEGEPNRVTFRTVMPAGFPDPRAAEADVSIGTEPARGLLLSWTPVHRTWFRRPPPPVVSELSQAVEDALFSYWDPSAMPPGGWVTAWSGMTPPRLIRIQFRFRPGSGLHWPPIIAATKRRRFQ